MSETKRIEALENALQKIAEEHEHQAECWLGDELADDGEGHSKYHSTWALFAREALKKARGEK